MADVEQTKFVSRGRPADADDRQWAAALTARLGLVQAAKLIGISKSALANVLAGVATHRGTHALLREARAKQSSAA